MAQANRAVHKGSAGCWDQLSSGGSRRRLLRLNAVAVDRTTPRRPLATSVPYGCAVFHAFVWRIVLVTVSNARFDWLRNAILPTVERSWR